LNHNGKVAKLVLKPNLFLEKKEVEKLFSRFFIKVSIMVPMNDILLLSLYSYYSNAAVHSAWNAN